MADVAEYAQKRLGGQIVLESGEPFDRDVERAKIEEVVKKLRDAGFEPGEHTTCRVLLRVAVELPEFPPRFGGPI